MTEKALGFQTVRLFKDQTLGIGSYGKVCKAKCDDLTCAAKLIHETLFDPSAQPLIAPERECRLPMWRFVQECEFLSTIRHPNIVQHLGIYQDPDNGQPALLMELMDDSLTHFLESSMQPILYHIQVNILHDILLALSFLHSNDIVHRDLSSNNVLLRGNVLAKVTDFGMARLCDHELKASNRSFTVCPGTSVYMPPEAFGDKPVYTEKMDCFSFGVISLQVLTRQFPKPGDRRKEIQINQPGLPAGTVAEVRVSEFERRQNHISKVNPNHSLLVVALDCLKDRDVERPSSHQLCERLAAAKETPEYIKSVKVTMEGNVPDGGQDCDEEVELGIVRQQHAQVLAQVLKEKNETISAMAIRQQHLREEVSRLESEMDQVIEEKDRELSHLKRQLVESRHVVAQFQRCSVELDRRRLSLGATTSGIGLQFGGRAKVRMSWKKGGKALFRMSACCNAVADDSVMYIRTGNKVCAYTASTFSWCQLPDSPTHDCPSVIINNLLTIIGGYFDYPGVTNKLFSLAGEGGDRRWSEKFPPMPTKRCRATGLCTVTSLIVAGGEGEGRIRLQTVEVMNTETLQWSTAADLPEPLCEAPGTICSNRIYVLSRSGSKSMYTCFASDLFQSYSSGSKADLWSRVAGPPVIRTTCVSVCGRQLAIGGMDSHFKPTAAVHLYKASTNSWEVVSHMATPRYQCFAAVLQNNQLMVVGGYTDHGETDSVELDTVE